MKRLALFGWLTIACCSVTLLFAIIDQYCLWDKLPILNATIRALGYVVVDCSP